LFMAFQNIGTVLFRKQMNFRRDFALQIAQKLAVMAISIPLAFLLRSYWALVAGMVAGRVVGVAVSYGFLPYRPRLCLKAWRGLLDFSKWMQINGILIYVRDRGYVLVMGRLLDAPSVGLFTLADEIASLPSTTLVAPLNRAVFPGFVRVSNDAAKLRESYRSMLGLIALIALPAAVGLAAVSALVVPVVLGSQWHATIPLLTLLALAGASRILTASTVSVHYATAQPHLQTLTTGIQAFTLIPMVMLGVLQNGVIGAAWAYLLHSLLVFIPVAYWFLLRRTSIRLTDAWEPLWRPIIAAAVMFAVVKPIANAWATPEAVLALRRLLLVVTGGALLYVTTAALLWWLSGRPAGAERVVLNRAGPLLRGLLGRSSS
jgi:O-antigen/teichoic acid export membrane protein